MTASHQTMIKYVIDTNVIRDLSKQSDDRTVREQSERCRRFWEIIKQDENAVLLIPEETKTEIEVQLLANNPHKESERKRILAAISDCQIAGETISRKAEVQLRRLSAILKSQYGERIRAEVGVTPQHLQVSDARVLCAALVQDGILVTRNVRDFILYLFLTDLDEDVLYDTGREGYVAISPELYQQVHEHVDFQTAVVEFFEELEAL